MGDGKYLHNVWGKLAYQNTKEFDEELYKVLVEHINGMYLIYKSLSLYDGYLGSNRILEKGPIRFHKPYE